MAPLAFAPDTRTTTEKLADRVRLKVDIVNELKPIAGANFASIVIQEIENSKLNTEGRFFEYFAQNIKEIVSNLKKKYSYGIKGDSNDAEAFRAFVEDAYNTTNSLKGTIKSSINRPSSSKTGLDKSGMDYFIKQMKHIQGIISKYHYSEPELMAYVVEIERKSKVLSDFLTSDEIMNNIRETFINNASNMDEIQVYIDRERGGFTARNIYSDIENYKKELPNIETLLTLISQFEKYITPGNNPNINVGITYLRNIDGMFPYTVLTEQINTNVKLFLKCSKMVGNIAIEQAVQQAEQQAILDRQRAEQQARDLEEAQAEIAKQNLIEGIQGTVNIGVVGGVAGAAYNEYLRYGAEMASKAATAAAEAADIAQGQAYNPNLLPSSFNRAVVAGLAYLGNQQQQFTQGPGGLVPFNGMPIGMPGPYGNMDFSPGTKDYYKMGFLEPMQQFYPESMQQSYANPIQQYVPNWYDSNSVADYQQSPAEYQHGPFQPQSGLLDEDDVMPGLETDLTSPENASAITKITEWMNGLSRATSQKSKDFFERNIKKMKDAWAERNGSDYDTDIQQKASGQGLKRGRGRPKGSGIVRPFKEKVDLSRGIEPDRRFIKFGKFLINTNKLKDDVVAIKRPSGSNIVEFPSQRVSPHLSHVFKRIIGGGIPSFNELSKLNETERNYLYNVSKKAEIVDKLSIPTPSKDQKDQDIHEYEVMKGEILSGNDNKELIKKFKVHMSKLSRQGVLPKKEVNEILTDLLELGH